MTELLDKRETARRLGISVRTFDRRRKALGIPHRGVSPQRPMFDFDQVVSYLPEGTLSDHGEPVLGQGASAD